MKQYLHAAGIKVRSFDELWSGCTTVDSRVQRIKELLEKRGLTGRLTLDKCKRYKKKIDEAKELSELDPRNIISEGLS